MDKFKDIYSPNTFEAEAKTVLSQLCKHISNTMLNNDAKVIDWKEPKEELRYWKDFMESGNKEEFIQEILKRTIHIHNPRYLGHQVAAPAPITALTGLVSSLLNNGMAVYEMGMAPSAMEKVVIDSICKKIGYTNISGGLLTSGGTLANLTALLSARKAVVEHDVWNKGHVRPLGVMVCEEAHYCVDRAAKIMGLGKRGTIKIPANKNYGMDTSLLEEYYQKAISEGTEIFAIIGSAPSTATGAYDNLAQIAQFAKNKNIWFHVDGAHGAAAIYSKKYGFLLKAIEQADSVVIDGHKMMLMPTITTALLFKDKAHMQNTFHQEADYLLDETPEEDWVNGGKKTFECTKTMMCLHWYVLLKYYGEELFGDFVTKQFDLARLFGEILNEDPEFELATTPQSNILCFRFVKGGLSNQGLNSLNLKIRQRLLEKGEFYIVQTKLRGAHYLRTTLMNPFTTTDHLKQLLGKIKMEARALV